MALRPGVSALGEHVDTALVRELDDVIGTITEMADRITVKAVEPSTTYRLRRDVLRPEREIADMALFGDDGPDTGVFGAIDAATGELVGTSNVRRAVPPPCLRESVAPGGATACWQLRGMATREDLRGRGIGARILGACVGHVAEHGGGFLWCNARVPARGFYAHGGFAEWGEEFESNGVTHVVMWRIVKAKDGNSTDGTNGTTLGPCEPSPKATSERYPR